MTFVLHLDAPQLTASSRIRGFTGSKLASFNKSYRLPYPDAFAD